VRDGDAWWIHNVGSKLYLAVVAADGTRAELPPGTRHAIAGGPGTGIMRALNAPNGVLLMPARSRDADGIGVRQIDDDWLVQPLAGVGLAGLAGEAHRVQFPLVL
jgi:hypothetical protein